MQTDWLQAFHLSYGFHQLREAKLTNGTDTIMSLKIGNLIGYLKRLVGKLWIGKNGLIQQKKLELDQC